MTHDNVTDIEREGFAPCPTCRQYSHSLGSDAVTKAFNHFHMLIAHPVRGHPMGSAFDDATKDAAQDGLVEALERSMVAIDDWLHIYASDMCDEADVQDSRQRIAEAGATLSYIASVQQNNRAALSAIKGDKS